MPIQQQAPIIIGLPPVFTNFTILVFSPIAAIASTMKNLLNSFIGVKKDGETPKFKEIVVIMDAIIK